MATVISVHSFRGGAGKTNTTANVAAQLAATGKRVAVVDTDIQSPGVHVLFGHDEALTPTLDEYLWGEIPIHQAAHDVTDRIERLTTVAAGGMLYLVPSSMKASDIAKKFREGYDIGNLNEGFRDLVRELSLDYLIINTQPDLDEQTLLSITISDVLLLILRPDQQDFQDTAVTVQVARRLDVSSLLLVVNKVPANIDMDDLRKQMTKNYDAETVAIMPLTEQVSQNASSDLFSLTHPEHPWSVEIFKIVKRVSTP